MIAYWGNLVRMSRSYGAVVYTRSKGSGDISSYG